MGGSDNTYIKSPETGRDIKVGGTTYNAMEKKYRRSGNKAHLHKLHQAKRFKKVGPRKRGGSSAPMGEKELARYKSQGKWESPTLGEIAEQGWTHEPAKLRRLKEQIKREHDGRGSRTRGWGAVFPRRGPERREVYKNCGSKCFLIPNHARPGQSKFPICPKCLNGKCQCRVACTGLAAAKSRAGQYGYSGVLSNATQLERALGCH